MGYLQNENWKKDEKIEMLEKYLNEVNIRLAKLKTRKVLMM